MTTKKSTKAKTEAGLRTGVIPTIVLFPDAVYVKIKLTHPSLSLAHNIVSIILADLESSTLNDKRLVTAQADISTALKEDKLNQQPIVDKTIFRLGRTGNYWPFNHILASLATFNYLNMDNSKISTVNIIRTEFKKTSVKSMESVLKNNEISEAYLFNYVPNKFELNVLIKDNNFIQYLKSDTHHLKKITKDKKAIFIVDDSKGYNFNQEIVSITSSEKIAFNNKPTINLNEEVEEVKPIQKSLLIEESNSESTIIASNVVNYVTNDGIKINKNDLELIGNILNRYPNLKLVSFSK